MSANYTKNTWTDRVVQYATRYALSLVSGSIYDVTASPGTVTNAGTAITAARLNNIEDGINNLALSQRSTEQLAMSGWQF